METGCLRIIKRKGKRAQRSIFFGHLVDVPEKKAENTFSSFVRSFVLCTNYNKKIFLLSRRTPFSVNSFALATTAYEEELSIVLVVSFDWLVSF